MQIFLETSKHRTVAEIRAAKWRERDRKIVEHFKKTNSMNKTARELGVSGKTVRRAICR